MICPSMCREKRSCEHIERGLSFRSEMKTHTQLFIDVISCNSANHLDATSLKVLYIPIDACAVSS